jgi:hypothetical protein
MEPPVGLLIVRCPNTNEPIDTGIDTEYESLSLVWGKSVLVNCPHCSEAHALRIRDGSLQSHLRTRSPASRLTPQRHTHP